MSREPSMSLNPKAAEFEPFDDADSDRPGIVVLAVDTPGADLVDELFWRVVTDAAWESEWYWDEDCDPFVGAEWSEVAEEFAAWVRQKIRPPEWRWWAWREYPEDDDEAGSTYLDPAYEHEPGAFRGALVILQ